MEASALTTASHSGLLARRSPLLRLQSDDRLVALIRDGHDRAFEVLFDRYQSRLLSFCHHMVGSADAEDLLQEVFVAAHAAMLADDRPINARPWLYRIARNRCLNHLRRPVADGQDTMDVHPHANGTTTFERVQKREELRTVVADVQELPETQRSALVLREIDGLSYTEIAQAMGVTLASVKSLLVRARMALAEASEARILACGDVRLELAEAAEGIAKISGPARRHVKECPSCKRFRGELRSTSRSLAALAPFGLFAVVGKFLGSVFGGGGASAGSTSGTAGAGAAGSVGTAGSVGAAGSIGGAAAAAGGSGITLGGALGTVGGVVGAKAAVGVATAALITAGAVGAKKFGQEPQPASQRPVAAASANPTNQWSVEHSRAEVATAAATPAPAVTASVPAEAPAAEPAPAEEPPATTEPPPTTDTAPPPVTETPPADTGTGGTTDETGGTGTTGEDTTDDGIADGSSNDDGDTDTGEDPDPDPPPVDVPPPDSEPPPPEPDPPPLTY